MRKLLLVSVAVGGMLAANAAHASEAEAVGAAEEQPVSAEIDDAADGSEIIVTARRANENLQDVPVAVTVLSAENLSKNNIVDAFGILNQIPAVQNIGRNVGQPGTSFLVRIRGVSPAAFYFNDAPLTGNVWGTFAPFFDISSVQVLKGPQGTLFGQASNAGAILHTPNRPGENFGGYVKASIGNYNFKSVEGAIDIPIVPDKVLLRVSGIGYNREGYIRDIYTDQVVDGKTRYEVGRATLVVRPSSAIENTTVFQMEQIHDLAAGSSATPGDYNMLNNTLNNTLATLNGMTLAQLLAARDQILANQVAIGPYRTQGWSVGCPASALSPATTSTVPGPNVAGAAQQPCAPGGGWIHSYGLFNTTTVNLGGNFSLKNIVSHLWGRQKFFGLYDNDGTRLIGNEANPRNLAFTNPMPRTWSEELQLRGKIGTSLDFTLGGFYYNEKNSPENPTFGGYTTSLGQSASKTFTETESYAIYGQANYVVAPGFTLTAGARHTWDAAFRRQEVLNPTTFAVTSTNGGPGTPTGEAHWQATSYTASAQYEIDPDTMIYINNSKGYSNGGLQNNARAPKFDPDTLNNIEAGLKTTIRAGDFRLRVNAAGYYGWWSDVKVGTFQLLPATPGSSVLVLTQTTANAASARIKGFELEVGGSIGNLFDFETFASYSDPHYTKYDFVNPLTLATVNLKDQPIQLTPKWKLGATVTMHVPVDRERIGDISLGLNATYRSQMWINPVKPIIPNDPNNPDTGAICMVPRTAQWGYGPLSADGRMAYKGCGPSFYNVNLNFNWDDFLGNEDLRLGFTVTNLTSNSDPVGLNSQSDTLNANGYQPNEPRMFYLTVGYKF